MKIILSILLAAVLGTSLNAQFNQQRNGRGLDRLFAILDTDSNEFLTEGEVLNALLTQQMLPQRELTVFANEVNADSDRPSRLSNADPDQFAERLFERADPNNDQVISKEEFLNQTTRRRSHNREG